MVHLEEVEDEELPQPSNKEFEDDGDYTDTESEISDDEDDLPESETIGDRIYALRDMIAPSTRQKLSTNVSTAGRWTWSGLCFGGRATFVVVTAVLFYGIPFTLSVAEESSILEMEKEQKMRDEGANMLIQGAETGGEKAQPAL